MSGWSLIAIFKNGEKSIRRITDGNRFESKRDETKQKKQYKNECSNGGDGSGQHAIQSSIFEQLIHSVCSIY